jgi:trehalose-phosphatase
LARLHPLWLHLGAIADRVRRAPELWLGTDFDGTLVPIMPRPEQVRFEERTRRALLALKRQPGVRLAVLSGRALPDLRRQLRVRGLFLAGGGGIETWDPARGRQVHLEPESRIARALKRELMEWCRRFEGAWLEDKRHSFALHYRAVPPRFREAFGAGVRRRVRDSRGGARLEHGKRVFEVMPAVRRDKATALEYWLDRRRPPLTVYLGDDTNDEPAHTYVRGLGGIAIAVGRTVSRAEYSLRDPDEVAWFLEWLAREWAISR